jgi:rhamnose transport system substrate-binding protein
MLRFLVCVIVLLLVSACNVNGNYKVIYENKIQKEEMDVKEQSNQYTMAIVPKIDGISYFNAVEAGALEAGKDLGINVLFKGPQTASWEQQEEIIEEFINQKVDLIAVSANDPDKLGPVLKKAELQNIRVITWDSDTDPNFREFYINMVDPEVYGRNLMDTLALQMGEQGDYVIMTGSKTTANLNEWIYWITLQQQEYYPNMILKDIVETDEDKDKAYSESIKILENQPDLKGVIALSTVNPPAFARAVRDHNRIGKISIIGSSTPNLMRSYIKEGIVDVVTLWSPQKLGYLTVSVASNLLNDISPYDGQKIQNVGDVRVIEDIIIMGQPIDFTKDNIDQYDF